MHYDCIYNWKSELAYHLKRGPVIAQIKDLRATFDNSGSILRQLSELIGRDVTGEALPNNKLELWRQDG